MNHAGKLKTIAGELTAVFPDKAPALVGKTELTPLLVQDGMVIAAGAVLNLNGKHVGVVTVSGVPVDQWPASKPRGRPKTPEKHLATLLAWCLAVNQCKGKRGRAYEQVAESFSYGDGKAVEKILKQQAVKYEISIAEGSEDIFEGTGNPSANGLDVSLIIKNPMWYKTSCGFEVCGQGGAWIKEFGFKIKRGAIQVQVPLQEEPVDIEKYKGKGFIIISVIQPGSK